MDRDAFLDRLRHQLATGVEPYGGAHALPRPDDLEVPRMRWPSDDRPLPEIFREALADHGGEGRHLRSAADLRELLASVVATHHVRSAVVTDEPTTAGVSAVLADVGVEVSPFDSPESATVDLGVTGAVGGIARTGTVVVDAGAAGGRSASLLPDVHVALLDTTTLVPEPADLWRTMTARYPAGLPSQVVLITGPSKSADIEGALTVGVHGPRAIWVGLLTR